MFAHGQTFREVPIHLDGCTFIECTFERCRMIYSGLIVGHIQRCNFVGCKWEFAGPAANTLGFMTALYGIDKVGPQMIDEIFQNIKKHAGRQSLKPSGSIALN